MNVMLGSLRPRLLAATLCCAAVTAAASPVLGQEPAGESKEHVVKRGDTLWDIAHAYLGNAFWWPRIYDVNRNIIRDPHWIYPGQRLIIMPGQPGDQPAAEVEAPPQPTGQERTAFYHPPSAETSSVAAELRPTVERGEFLSAPWITDVAGLPVVGRMLDRVRVEGGVDRLAQLALLMDRLYIRNEGAAPRPAPGAELLLVADERTVLPYGTIVVPTALVKVERTDRDVMTVQIVRQYGEVTRGQRALPVPAFSGPAPGPARPVENGVEGDLVAFVHDQPVHTTTESAFVSLGAAAGIKPGDELEVFAPTRQSAADPGVELPPESVARLRVIKVEDRTATARVLSMRQAALQPGLKVRLVARVP